MKHLKLVTWLLFSKDQRSFVSGFAKPKLISPPPCPNSIPFLIHSNPDATPLKVLWQMSLIILCQPKGIPLILFLQHGVVIFQKL